MALSSPVSDDVEDVRFKLNRMLPSWIPCLEYSLDYTVPLDDERTREVSFITRFEGDGIEGGDVLYNRYCSEVETFSESVTKSQSTNITITRVERLGGGYLIDVGDDFEVCDREVVLGGGIFRFCFDISNNSDDNDDNDDNNVNDNDDEIVRELENEVGCWCGVKV